MRDCKKHHKRNHHKPRPWKNITLTKGYKYVFASGAYFIIQRDQFALIATPHGCVRGHTVSEKDGFKLLQLDTGNGNILQPIDVERLVNNENPVDPWYAPLDDETKARLDARVDELSGRPATKYLVTAVQTSIVGSNALNVAYVSDFRLVGTLLPDSL